MEAMCSGVLFAMKISLPQAGLKPETARSVGQRLTYWDPFSHKLGSTAHSISLIPTHCPVPV